MPGKRVNKHPDREAFFKALGKRLRELRKERGWSAHTMVVEHGYYESQWRKYEKGGTVTVDTLLRFATLFQLTVCELLGGVGEFPRRQAPEKSAGAPGQPGRNGTNHASDSQ